MLVFGIEKMPKGIIRSSFFEPWQEEAGLAATPAYFALRAQRLHGDSGVTKEQLAAVVVKNRRQGVANPDAMFRSEVDAEEVLASRVVCEPLHLWMLCSPTREPPPWCCGRRGRGSQSRRCASAPRCCARTCPGRCSASRRRMSGLVDDTDSRRRPRWPPTPPTRKPGSARRTSTWWSARTPTPPASCSPTRSSGSARRASRRRLVDEGATALGGRLPVNPSGGLLSKGEPLGASALGQVVELVRQLRGQPAPARSTERASALAHTVGRGANASVVVLESLSRRSGAGGSVVARVRPRGRTGGVTAPPARTSTTRPGTRTEGQ